MDLLIISFNNDLFNCLKFYDLSYPQQSPYLGLMTQFSLFIFCHWVLIGLCLSRKVKMNCKELYLNDKLLKIFVIILIQFFSHFYLNYSKIFMYKNCMTYFKDMFLFVQLILIYDIILIFTL